jgi:beta-N-acetylhexosaminidase
VGLAALPVDVRRLVLSCLLPGFPGAAVTEPLRELLAAGLGGVCLFKGNITSPDAVSQLVAELRELSPALLVAVDEEGGDVTRLDARTGSDSPGNAALGAADDTERTSRIAATIGGRLGAAGINLNLAPVADVNNNPRNPVIGIRSFGADTELVARHTAAYVAGLQTHRVAACAKHFPGHGDTTGDSHHELPVITLDRARLDAVELPPFRAAIAAGVKSIMTAHIVVQALDPERPATVSPTVLRLLRDELGFDGVVISDALDMQAVAGTLGMGEAAVQAIAAGVDLLCLGNETPYEDTQRVADALADALAAGRIPEKRLAEAAGRVAALAEWARTPIPGDPDPALGLAAARRAVSVTGGDPRLGAPPVVVEIRAAGSMAVGDTVWGIAPVLAAAAPGTVALAVTEAPTAGLLTGYEDRPVVIAYRDAHLHAWQQDALAALRTARPDAVLVAMGGHDDLPDAGHDHLPDAGRDHLPRPAPGDGAAVLRTLGSARVNAVAAVEHLLGRELTA